MRFHRFRYLKNGETILCEPKRSHYVWMVMYIPPSHRGDNLVEIIFTSAVRRLRGIHHIHCSKRVSSFKKLSKDYHWEYKGQSKYFIGCSDFRFDSLSTEIPVIRGFRISHEILKRKPSFKTFYNNAHAKSVIELIDEDTDNLR